MIASSDCELIRSGLLDQPVNALTSLSFVVVAAVMRHRPVLAVLAALTGIGSFLYHGFGGGLAHWLHDTSLAMLLVGLVAERRPAVLAGAALILGVGFTIAPESSVVLTGMVAVVAAGILVRAGVLADRRSMTALAVLGLGAVVGALSRSGGPLCYPDSVVQGHAVWHMAAAAALVIWSAGRPASDHLL